MLEQLELRDVLESDLPVFFEHQRDPEGCRMAAFQSREEDAFYAHWAKIVKDPQSLVQTIVVHGEVVGSVCSFIAKDKREVGYWIGKEHWGKGIATRALSEFLRLVTDRPLYAFVASHNTASIRVLEKCGFVSSGQSLTTRRDGEEVEEMIMELNSPSLNGNTASER